MAGGSHWMVWVGLAYVYWRLASMANLDGTRSSLFALWLIHYSDSGAFLTLLAFLF